VPSHPSTGIGIVGAGFIAESHAQAASGHPGLRVTAVHDLSPAAAAALAARHGARVHATLGDLLADPGVDAVILGTPNDTHTRLALQIAAAGKHLLLEKPLALSVDDAVEIAAAFRESGLTLLVGHTHRHADYARTVHATLRAGAIGRVRSLRIAITAGWIWGNWGAWVLDPAHSGGHAFQNGVHLYDLAGWWMGDRVDRVAALGQKLTSAALAIDDSLVTTLHFRGGGSAVCEISRGERPKGTALFEIVAHGTLGNLVRRWDSDGAVVFSEGFAGSVPAVGLSPFERQLAVWHDAIHGVAPVTPDPNDAIHAVAVAVAAHRAAEQGDTIDVQETA
jgi:predicted dehydrogenase